MPPEHACQTQSTWQSASQEPLRKDQAPGSCVGEQVRAVTLSQEAGTVENPFLLLEDGSSFHCHLLLHSKDFSSRTAHYPVVLADSVIHIESSSA